MVAYCEIHYSGLGFIFCHPPESEIEMAFSLIPQDYTMMMENKEILPKETTVVGGGD